MKRMLLVILMMSLGATYSSSLFPLFQEQFNLSSLEITLLFAIYAAFLLPTLLIVGSRGPAWGLKRVLRVSILLSIGSTILFVSSHQAWMLFAARMVEGIAYGAFTGTASAFLLQQSSKDRIGTALKLSGITITTGFGIGPAISAIIIQYLDIAPLRVPFWLLIVLLIISFAILESLTDASTSAPKAAAAKISLGVPEELRAHFWSFIAMAVFIIFTLNGIVLSLIPGFVKDVVHSSNHAIPGLLILLLLGGSSLVQLVTWPTHPVTRIRTGVIFLLAGAWTVVTSGEFGSLALLWGGVFLQAIGTGLAFQASLQLVGKLTKPDIRAKVITTYYLAAYSGFIVPTIGVGILTMFVSLHIAIVVLNIIATFIIAYMLFYSVIFKRYYTSQQNEMTS